MKKVYETPALEILRYVFSQPVADLGDNDIEASGIFPQ